MTTAQDGYRGGENFDLRQMLLKGRSMRLNEKVALFDAFRRSIDTKQEMLFMRCVTSPADREVQVADAYTGREKTMLMFGSNNYLGLANHPTVLKRVEQALHRYGAGIGGPPS